MTQEIEGIDKNEFPRLYRSLDRLMAIYGFNKIYVDPHYIKENPNIIYLGASTHTKGKFIRSLKTTSITINYLETELSDDELDGLIGCSFGYMNKYLDVIPAVPVFIIGTALVLVYVIEMILHWKNLPFFIGFTIFFFVLFILAILLGSLISGMISRRFILGADRDSIARLKKPEALRSALIKFHEKSTTVNNSMKDQANTPLIKLIIAVRGLPTLEQRLKKIEKYKLQMEDGSV